MFDVLLTQNSTPIFKYIVSLLGVIMNAIYEFLYFIGIGNVGLVIILFTIVMYMLMLPLTMKQQRFSKLSAKMNPEIQAIRDKYKNRRDSDSMMQMNAETKAVYAKYGVSPAGGCLQLLIQMPVLFALYQVIYSIPGYVTKIKALFMGLVTHLGEADIEIFKGLFEKSSNLSIYLNKLKPGDALQNKFIDLLNHFNASDWETLRNSAEYGKYSDIIDKTQNGLADAYNFLGLNIGYSPSSIISDAWGANWLLVVGAVLIPILAGLTQYINIKLAPQAAAANNNNGPDTMGSSMKVMNMVMPVISIIFCYSLQVGVGLYWIGSSIVRTVQQIIINKHIDKMDLEDLMKKNLEKVNKKRARMGLPPQQLNAKANINTKSINTKANVRTKEQIDADVKKSTDYYNKNAKPGSLASKVNMVKQYNEKNTK